MLLDLEIYRAAQATIKRYGDDAGIHAAQRADDLMAEGDMDGRAVWYRIERAIGELRKSAPGDDTDLASARQIYQNRARSP